MTLLELLLEKNITWPDRAKYIVQDADHLGACFTTAEPHKVYGSNNWWVKDGIVLRDEEVQLSKLASDWETTKLSREEYESNQPKYFIVKSKSDESYRLVEDATALTNDVKAVEPCDVSTLRKYL